MLKKIGFIQKEKIYKAKHVRFGQVNMLSFYKKNNSIKKSKIEGNISQNTL